MTRWFVFVFLFVAFAPVHAGTVEGEVTVKVAKKVNRPKSYSGGRYSGGARKGVKTAETENVVVSVPGLKSPKREKKTPSIMQRGKEFRPYVTAIRVGDDVEFPNGDKVYHSVYSESATCKFHLDEYPKGSSQSVNEFTKAGHVEIFCAIHSHMNAHILVLNNDFFVKPDAKGKFRLENLPPGKHKIQAWHPKLGTKTQLVEVPKEGVVKVNFNLK